MQGKFPLNLITANAKDTESKWHYYDKMAVIKLNISQPLLCGSMLAVLHCHSYTIHTYKEAEMYSYHTSIVLQILTCYSFLIMC
jgi:hypothetical protein